MEYREIVYNDRGTGVVAFGSNMKSRGVSYSVPFRPGGAIIRYRDLGVEQLKGRGSAAPD